MALMKKTTWQDYIEAANRKLEIAAYHKEQLGEAVRGYAAQSDQPPPIAVQAHFEGVVVSVMAAMDQVAQAVNSAWELGLKPTNLVEKAFRILAERIPAVADWFGEYIGVDLRRIRTRMIHYSYSKTPQGESWVVESANPKYSGSRELVAYITSAVEHGKHLNKLLPLIKNELAKQGRN